MPQMTPGQARVVDPVLTNVAQGYKNQDLAWPALFPRVDVPTRGGKIITFGAEDFLLYNTRRAPGANTKRMNFGYASGSYSLTDHSLEPIVPVELMQESAAVPRIDMAGAAVMRGMNIIGLRLEKECADLATTAANYPVGNKVTLSGTSQWSDFSGTSDPIADVETAKEAVRSKTGKYPTTMVVGPLVMKSLRQHPKIVDRIKYTSKEPLTQEVIARLFGLRELVVGAAVYATDQASPPTLVDVWGKFAVVAYAETASLADLGTPSFGYTYQLTAYPYAEEAYLDRNTKTWIFPVTDAVQPVIAASVAGYLITAAVA